MSATITPLHPDIRKPRVVSIFTRRLILRGWRRGENTADIADRLRISEAEVANTLADMRERGARP